MAVRRFLRSTLRTTLATLAALALWATPARAQSFIASGGSADITADEGCVIIRTERLGGAAVTISNTYSGQAEFEVNTSAATATCATGNGWAAKTLTPSNGGPAAAFTTGTGTWEGSVAGYALLRVRASALASGTVTVTIGTGQAPGTAGFRNIQTIELAFTAAQTDTAIVSASSGTVLAVTGAGLVCDHANTVDVGFRIGFGTATTPTTTGVFLSHPGVAPGSGYERGGAGGLLGTGADGADIRITAEEPTTGSCRALISYFTVQG